MPRVMEIDSPLGETLLFFGMHAREELSRLSEFQIDFLSPEPSIDVNGILGKNVTVKLMLPDESVRFFNGYVTRFSQRGRLGRFFRYSAIVRPWLWFLTRTADCRIFQDKSVPDILETVFADHGTADFEKRLTGSYRTWKYCVQYRETDFNFVSRLMEHEGIYYYFKHDAGRNTLILCDSYSAHEAYGDYATIPFFPPERLIRPELEHVRGWEFSRQVEPGAYVHDDYDFERPSVELKVNKSAPRPHAESAGEVYDYPGYYVVKPEGQTYVEVRLDEYAAQWQIANGVTNARGLCNGFLFTLDGFERPDQNREHLITGASWDLEFGQYEGLPFAAPTDYRCTFACIPSDQQFRPARITPKPFVQGPQTAVVVGPDGDEIYTDEHARVKVQFHWDRRGEKNQNSSCWLRVSQPWAGKGWGSVAIPRMGQEVIVDFLEGDPDQPIVTGRVYNKEQAPPFGFPAGAVISGIKSDTHKGDGYNEMSFDDTAGTEKITIHGQFDMNSVIEHDQTLLVHNNRTDRIDVDDAESVGNNQSCEVGVDQSLDVGANQTIHIGADRTETVDANETVTIMADRSATVNGSETATVMMQRSHTVGINETITVGVAQEITVGAAQTITVGANQSTNVGVDQSVEVGANASMTVGGDESRSVTGNRTTAVKKDDNLSVTKNLGVTAGESIVITTGDASISMKKDGTIMIKGKDITIDGSGKITIKAGGDIVMKGSKIVQN